ncbi:MAG: hypothetical protein PUH02_03330, partial [bacterium]|nr:hypothetical protein [bacterium]
MAKTTEKKMMTKEKGHGVTGKKRSRRGKRVAAWFLAIAMMLTTISLPGNVKQASAMAISEKSVAIEMDGPILKKVTYDFRSLGASQNGIWYLYVWVKGDTSGVDGTPEIIAETALRSVDGDNTMEIDVDGQEGVVYSFGVCMKGSWCTESSPEGWPAITGIEDYELLSAKTTEDNVTVQVNGKEVSDSAEEVMENPEKYICYHEWEVTETLKPDCIHDGYNIQTCKKCKETSKVLSGIPALGHHYEDGVCSRCQMEDPTPVKPTGEGTEESPYQIKTTGELYWFAGLVNGDSTVCDYNEESKPDGIQQNPSAYAELKNNIVVNKGVLDEEGNPVTAHYTEWMPIGALGNPYSGMFDGNNYTISGLYFYDTDRKFAGFFGYAAPGTVIQNTVIADSYFCGKQTIGGICGWNRGTVTGCHNKATVEAWMSITIDSSNTNSLAGGICGGNADIGLIEDSVNDGKVLANNDYAGGIAGSNYNIITGCYNSGQIKGNDYVGGVAGMNQDNVVTNCYNSGLVKGDITVGGVVGYSTSATVANCYNIGTVEGISEVGGIAGDTSFSTVVHSYFLEGTKKEYYATSKSACQFANGEVAFLLSQGCTTEVTSSQDSSVSTVTFDGSVWGQNIDNEGERQYYPALNGDTAKVYETSAESGCQGYSNTKDKVREHYFGENCTDEICD